MTFNRTLGFAVSLGLVFLALTGSALAGTTTAPNINYAREIGTTNLVVTLPAAAGSPTRVASIVRSVAQDLFIDVTLGNGATFATGNLPAAGDLSVSGGGPATYVITIISGGTNGTNTVRYFVDIQTADQNALPTYTLDVTTWTIRDVSNVLGAGNSISLSMASVDPATNTPVDVGSESDPWLFGAFGTSVTSLTPTSAVIDVATNRKNFLATAPDTLTVDNGATLGIDNSVTGVNAAAGTAYTLITASKVVLTLSGNLAGLTSWSWGGNSDAVTAGEITAGTTLLTLDGDNASLTGTALPFTVTVNGTTTLESRTLTVKVDLQLSGGVDGPAANNRNLLATSDLTVWTLNGTILVANWTNGNNAAFSGRMYLWNPSPVSGAVTIRVFTLPVGFGGSTLLGTVNAGTLAASSGTNIRLAEDVLTPIAIPLPYTVNGGNLVVEITINANNVSGYTQVFSGSFAFGSVPMTKVQ